MTVLVVAATAALFLAMALAGARARIQRVDDAFARDMVAIRQGWLTGVGKVLDVLGSSAVTMPVRAIVAGFLAFRRRWWHLVAFVGAVAVSEALKPVLKAVYDRPRPLGSLVHTTGSSFPSGHALGTMVTLVAAMLVLLPEGRARYAWGAVALTFSVLMGLSRAYLLAHWLSDAVAGVLLGTAIALVTALVVHAVMERRRSGLRAPPFAPNRYPPR